MDVEKSIERESRARSLLKALSWRIIATLTTTTLAFIFTGEVEMAMMIGGAEFFIKFFIYYIHERAWQMLPRGTVRSKFASE